MGEEIVCTSCGYVGDPARVTKGNDLVELLLWICFAVPGLCYSVWRYVSRYDACPRCGNAEPLPFDSPQARKFLQENRWKQPS